MWLWVFAGADELRSTSRLAKFSSSFRTRTDGSPRVVMELRKQGKRHGRNRVARLISEEGLCGRQNGRYRLQTTDSNHDEPIAPNRLAEAPEPTAPNQIRVQDIIYIETQEGWLYLAAILDLYSRKIVGWAMSPSIDTALVLKALAMALLHRQPLANLLCHVVAWSGTQGDPSTTRRFGGAGVGLAITQPLAKMMGGYSTDEVGFCRARFIARQCGRNVLCRSKTSNW